MLNKLSRDKIKFWRDEWKLSRVKWKNYCAINEKNVRAINGRLDRSQVTGCNARYFRGQDDDGCNSWQVLS